jgi:hypothetical protein
MKTERGRGDNLTQVLDSPRERRTRNGTPFGAESRKLATGGMEASGRGKDGGKKYM